MLTRRHLPGPLASIALDALPPHRRPFPSKLFVELTTRCNLRCAMCVKQAPGQRLVQGDMSDETFARIAPAFPHLESLVLNGIGEPTLHRGLEAFIEQAKAAMPAGSWVGFQTNGQLLGRGGPSRSSRRAWTASASPPMRSHPTSSRPSTAGRASGRSNPPPRGFTTRRVVTAGR